MRPLDALCLVAATLLLPGVCLGLSYGDDRYECQLRCAAERDTRIADCPSPYGSADSGQERAECMKNSQAAYLDCVRGCPPPPPASSSSGGETLPPASTQY